MMQNPSAGRCRMKRFTVSATKTKKTLPWLRALTVLFWMILWQWGSMVVGSDLILPSPMSTLQALGTIFLEQEFWGDVGWTLLRVFGGIAISILVGYVLGVICGLWQGVYCLVKPVATILRTLPIVSVIILINLWVKSGWVPLVVSFMVCFPIVWTNVVEGIWRTDLKLLEMAQVFGVSIYRVVRGIYLPSVRPYLRAAVMNAIGMGWKATVTAEVLANALPSMGMELYYSKIYLETPTLFAWTLVLVAASFAIEGGVRLVLRGREV